MRLSRPASLAFAALLACGNAQQNEAVVAPSSSASSPISIASASPPPTSSSTSTASSSTAPASASSAAPRLCGCKLCEPIVSDDDCATDSDCARETPCHAKRCVGVARATLPKPGQSCTMILMCGTADANACTCNHGKCALGPR